MLNTVVFLLQTKGVKNYVAISQEKGAWLAAVGAAGAMVVGTAIIWPIMARMLKKYDHQQMDILEAGKGADDHHGTAFGEEDKFQKAVASMLQPVEVGAEDKSINAMLKRFRWDMVLCRGILSNDSTFALLISECLYRNQSAAAAGMSYCITCVHNTVLVASGILCAGGQWHSMHILHLHFCAE